MSKMAFYAEDCKAINNAMAAIINKETDFKAHSDVNNIYVYKNDKRVFRFYNSTTYKNSRNRLNEIIDYNFYHEDTDLLEHEILFKLKKQLNDILNEEEYINKLTR